jgi:hypothetical protein
MSNRGLRAVSFVAALLIVGAACSSGGSKGPSADSTTIASSTPTSTQPGSTTIPVTTPTTGATSSSTPTTVAAAYNVIAGLTIVNVPSGFVLQPDRLADTGATNLAKAIQDSAAGNAPAVLRQAGFTVGYQRAWVAPGGDRQNAIFLYQFATAAGASQYTADRVAEIQATLDPGLIKNFPVLIQGAVGVHNESATSSFAAVVVAKGVYSIEAVATAGTKDDQSLDATALADAQYKRLP